jgi:hypothetical protein
MARLKGSHGEEVGIINIHALNETLERCILWNYFKEGPPRDYRRLVSLTW